MMNIKVCKHNKLAEKFIERTNSYEWESNSYEAASQTVHKGEDGD